MKSFRSLASFLVLFAFFSSAAWAAHYNIDPDHTTVSFKIRHLLSYMQGRFNQFEGSFEYDPETPDTWKARMTVQAASIDTNVERRDQHLRAADFFDAGKFPALSFVSTEVTDVTPASAKLNGLLTLHGVEKPVTFDLQMHGAAKDPWGNTRSAFTATTTLNRKDFGLTWNKALETGRLLVGEEVIVTLEVEGILQTEATQG